MLNPDKILIAVPESDSHVVAAKLLELFMSYHGFDVTNLGANSSVAEIVEAADREKPIAVLISSQNGHASADLHTLRRELNKVAPDIPVILGGKLSINPMDRIEDLKAQFHRIGIDVAEEFDEALTMIRMLDGRKHGGSFAIAN